MALGVPVGAAALGLNIRSTQFPRPLAWAGIASARWAFELMTRSISFSLVKFHARQSAGSHTQ